jgi:ATP-dependent DNA helicase RecG
VTSAHLLDQSLRQLLPASGVKALETKLELRTVGDLLGHYPRRYVTRGELTDLAGLVEGEDVTILAEVVSIKSRRMQRRRGTLVEVVVTDGTGRLTLTFFNQAWRGRQLHEGARGMFAGRVTRFGGSLQLTHPEFVPLSELDAADADVDELSRQLIPVYPAAAGLASWRIAKAVDTVLVVADDLEDPVPADVRDRLDLVGLADAYRLVHRPESRQDVERARARLRFDEAFVLQTVLAQRRHRMLQQPATARRPRAGGLLDAFDARLPFSLTAGQREVAREIAEDLALEHPMHRLLQGEVGSGKTVVALRAMLAVVDTGGQAALLAPTEVLAVQHLRSLTDMLGPLAAGGMLGGSEQATRVALLTGSQGTAVRRQALLDAASGDAGIVIGTHALLQERVDFFDLGLVVVDEQHRFGVEQRDALRAKAEHPPHLLVMTATPIPRTVAMTVFGDLDVSTLRELPQGRAEIATHVVPVGEKPHYLSRTWQRVREEVAADHQAYVVAPRIGEAAAADRDASSDRPSTGGGDVGVGGSAGGQAAASVVTIAQQLEDGPLKGLRLGVLHGRLPSDAKDAVMRGFASGDIDVLVATTVIEVGVDVPNATVMAVMDADRFGVSQLHQLRGRVGRGGAGGLCLLVTHAEAGSPGRERLEAVAATVDGFELAQLDLEQRREGDVLGTAQAGGRSSLRLLRAVADAVVIEGARKVAADIVAADPTLASHAALSAEVDRALAEERDEYLDKA